MKRKRGCWARWAVVLTCLSPTSCERRLSEVTQVDSTQCGDGDIDPGELCDDGNADFTDSCPSGPRGNCQLPVCGDGFAYIIGFGANEQCDDGNDVAGDGCDGCLLETNWVCADYEPNGGCWCGPGFQNNDADETCTVACNHPDAPQPGPHEVCDDSSGVPQLFCTSDALRDPVDGLCELTACSPSCGPHQTCVNTGTPTCTCYPHWVGASCETCRVLVDIDTACTDHCDGQTWDSAVGDITTGMAIAAAAALGEGTCDVWVTSGHYYLFQKSPEDTLRLLPGVALYGGFVGTETTRDERDWRANLTILDGHSAAGSTDQVYHVITADDADGATVDGFVITGGSAMGRHGDSDVILDDDGGGLLVHETEGLTVANSWIVSNRARTEGGGVRTLYSEVTFDNTVFSANGTLNTVQWNRGGALYANGTSVTISRSIFAGNFTAQPGGGAAIELNNPNQGQPNVVTTSVVVGNDTNRAFSAGNSDGVFRNLTMAAYSDADYGAAIYNTSSAPTVTNSIFAAYNGEAFYQHAYGHDATFAYCLVEGKDTTTACGGHSACLWATGVFDDSPGFEQITESRTGAWESVDWDPETVRTTLTDAQASWTPGALEGRFVQANRVTVLRFPIFTNTATTLVVLGDLTPFVGPTNAFELFDYRLAADSPAIDAGTDLSGEGVVTDLDGTSYGVCHTGTTPNCYDLGAYERP